MARWESFYVIIGSSGAALVGIQFLVVTLVANMRRRPPAESVAAFATPTVVHFTGALLISAIMSAPWRSLLSASVALAVCGVGGLAYTAVVIRRERRQTFYLPVWQDWLWYAVLPSGVYGSLGVAALFLRGRTADALFVIAADALGMLLIGIHNSWDSVLHLVVGAGADADAAADVNPGADAVAHDTHGD
jgi:hypothetical protein